MRSAFLTRESSLPDEQSLSQKASHAAVPRLPALGASFPAQGWSPPVKRSVPLVVVAIRLVAQCHGRASLVAWRAASSPPSAAIASRSESRTYPSLDTCHRCCSLGFRHVAISGEIGGLIGFDIKREQTPARIELRACEDAPSQFEVIADVEEFDRVGMILGKLQKGVGAGGDHPAAELERLGYRARGGLPHLQIGKYHCVADRHPRQEIGIALRAQKMNSARQVFGMLDQQVAHRPVDSEGDAGRPGTRSRSFDDAGVDITGFEQ